MIVNDPSLLSFSGFAINFSCQLQPEIAGFKAELDGKYWLMKKIDLDASLGIYQFISSLRLHQITSSGSDLPHESDLETHSDKLDEMRVLKLVNSPKDLVHCGRLFNISCQYGVSRITIKDDNSCYIELVEQKDADVALRCLQGLHIFGAVLEISLTCPRAVRSHGGETLNMEEFDHIGGSMWSKDETRVSKVDLKSNLLIC